MQNLVQKTQKFEFFPPFDFRLKTPRVHSVDNVKFGKTHTSKLFPFMRILSNNFKIVVVLKIVAYYLQLRSP